MLGNMRVGILGNFPGWRKAAKWKVTSERKKGKKNENRRRVK